MAFYTDNGRDYMSNAIELVYLSFNYKCYYSFYYFSIAIGEWDSVFY